MSRIPPLIRRVIGLPSRSITASESGEFGLFGTSKLPPRNLDSRNAAASLGRILFISIAVFCAVILAVLLTRIYGEAFVPENEIEISDTQLQWKASTWDSNWPLDDPRRYERNNITLEATWTIATYGGMGLDGSLLVDANGDPVVSDLMDTMRTNLCLNGLASSTYLPIEAWSVGSLFGAERQELSYNPIEDRWVNLLYTPNPPNDAMGDYWIDSNTDEAWTWNGLRWINASQDIFLQGLLQHYSDRDDFDTYNRVYYTEGEPLSRNKGDLWFQDPDPSTGEFTRLSIYNQTTRIWDDHPILGISRSVLNPDESLETFVPSFCTREEVAVYIFEESLTGAASIGERENPDGYRPVLQTSRKASVDLTVTVTPSGLRNPTIHLTEEGFSLDGEIITRISIQPETWLFLEYDGNETITYIQKTGPPADARETSYTEIGDFILGNPTSWIKPNLWNDDDLDNDGIVDECDDDIDGDGLSNPVMGGNPDQCPNAIPAFYEDGTYNPNWWLDRDEDGIHDDIEDNDIDGDRIPNWINGQGRSMNQIWSEAEIQSCATGAQVCTSFNASMADPATELGVLWDFVLERVSTMCEDGFKSSEPDYASRDCDRGTQITQYSISTNPAEFCDDLRFIDYKNYWVDYCGRPSNWEGWTLQTQSDFDEAYTYSISYIPLFSIMILLLFVGVMLRPEHIVPSIVGGIKRMDLNSPKASKTRYLSFANEIASRLLGLIWRILILIISLLVFLPSIQLLTARILVLMAALVIFTLATTRAKEGGRNRSILATASILTGSLMAVHMLSKSILLPFTFAIGGSFSSMALLAIIAAVRDLAGTRVEKEMSRSDGFVDGLSLVGSTFGWIVALWMILAKSWVVPAIAILLSVSAIKRLLVGSLQLSRSEKINLGRVRTIIQGRAGWMTVSFVVLALALFTVPVSIQIPFVWSNFPSSEPYNAGLRAAFWGSVYVVAYTMLFAIPVSIGAAIWLEEYAPRNRLRSAIQTLITNLAGVPAVVFGLFGLAVFLTDRGIGLNLGGSILTAGLTMATMAMPTIVISSQEALRAVPSSIRSGAFGLGCTKWQVIKDHVIPHSLPGMMTGTILAMSRIMGEAAPLILVGAVASTFQEPDAFYYVDYSFQPRIDAALSWLPGVESHATNLPIWADRDLFSANVYEYYGPASNTRGRYTVLPVQVYRWTDAPSEGFKVAAAGTSLVLLATLVAVNSAAILIRAHYRRYSST
ncbi:MAG: phosphate ABC transporter permease PstA [Candidatus Thermoplasmatota archaeon]|nr:phosphate ABC transporter permease PstA [Candidatus Thermoplasmatota archaeon]MEC8045549.1 phosphate ABC transporter permease PstA [Candidatus Thermoplasmatota archaeon]